MQAVDVLGDDVRDVAARDELRAMADVPGAGLRLADRLADHQETPPGFKPRLLRGEEILELDRLVFGPEAAGRAEVRNAGFGRDACTREDHRAACALDHARQFFYVSLKQEVTP